MNIPEWVKILKRLMEEKEIRELNILEKPVTHNDSHYKEQSN
jgi:hypothetical protein